MFYLINIFSITLINNETSDNNGNRSDVMIITFTMTEYDGGYHNNKD